MTASPAATAPLFDSSFLRRLELLALEVGRTAAGDPQGARRSSLKGPGIEFADHRSYEPGDGRPPRRLGALRPARAAVRARPRDRARGVAAPPRRPQRVDGLRGSDQARLRLPAWPERSATSPSRASTGSCSPVSPRGWCSASGPCAERDRAHALFRHLERLEARGRDRSRGQPPDPRRHLRSPRGRRGGQRLPRRRSLAGGPPRPPGRSLRGLRPPGPERRGAGSPASRRALARGLGSRVRPSGSPSPSRSGPGTSSSWRSTAPRSRPSASSAASATPVPGPISTSRTSSSRPSGGRPSSSDPAMTFLSPSAFWLAGSIPVLILIHTLRLKRDPVVVPSILLWQQARWEGAGNRFSRRITDWLSLLLQILVAACLVTALARPALLEPGTGSGIAVLVLDRSASMQAGGRRGDPVRAVGGRGPVPGGRALSRDPGRARGCRPPPTGPWCPSRGTTRRCDDRSTTCGPSTWRAIPRERSPSPRA